MALYIILALKQKFFFQILQLFATFTTSIVYKRISNGYSTYQLCAYLHVFSEAAIFTKSF